MNRINNTERDFIDEIKRQVNYAARSFSLELMYEVYGYLKACRECGVLSAFNYVDLSGKICRDWLNNGRWSSECDRYGVDVIDTRKEIRKAILKEKGIE